MLHALLKKQIVSHLGENLVINSNMTSLLEIISQTYQSFEEENSRIQSWCKKSEELSEEYRHNFLQLVQILEKATKQVNRIMNEMAIWQHDQSPVNNENPLIGALNRLEEKIHSLHSESGLKDVKILELERLNKELDQFAYIVSHDLKAPLRAISNLSQWIEDDISELLKNQTKDNFRLLRSRVVRMESLINAILSYAKATKSKNHSEMADTNWLLNEVIDSLNFPSHIKVRVVGSLPVIKTESIKLQQVFSNLISNAIKYNDKENGIIEIGVFETEEHCQFYIQDNGPGIEPQFQKKVFMIFQTIEAKDDYESTGIGLAIVKKIIDEKGGKIWIESEKGKGARFVFLWPKEKAESLQKI